MIFGISKVKSVLLYFFKYYDIERKIPLILSLAAVASGLGTHWALTHSAGQKSNKLLNFIYLDVILVTLLVIFVSKRLLELWLERKQRRAGSKLHVNIVGLFSTIALTPAICVAIFSAFFFNSSIEAWFGKPIKGALSEASEVANAYMHSQQQTVVLDAEVLASKLRPSLYGYLQDDKGREELIKVLNEESEGRGIGELLICNSSGQVIAKSSLTLSFQSEQILSFNFEEVQDGGVIFRAGKDRVRALIQIDKLTDTYLFVGKLIDPSVFSHISQTQKNIREYYSLSKQQTGAKIAFLVFFSLVCLLLLLASVLAGLYIANFLIKPITRLIEASEAVSHGDLTVKIDLPPLKNEIDDLINSFNNMTARLLQQNRDLTISQRKAAWADVARKIAHEIKNPLTPIQLSAERLKRKYSKEIETDPQTFTNCIDTIVRQVGHIGSLVDEFTSFARMPDPVLVNINIIDLAEQSLVLLKQAYQDIDFVFKAPPKGIVMMCDAQQMTQVITNLLHNSVNALKEIENTDCNKRGVIVLKIEQKDDLIHIIIEDNGPGFPGEGRERLIEPYYTTRKAGTGLGLAIVSKIVNDHNGKMELLDSDSELGGACVKITFDDKN